MLDVAVHDHYGQTEAGMLINNHHHPALVALLKTGSMCKPLPGWSMLVLKETEDAPAPDGELGRVAVEFKDSPLAWFSGYIDDPKKSAEKFAGEGAGISRVTPAVGTKVATSTSRPVTTT